MTIWDVRILFSRANQMKSYKIPKIFINRDLCEEDKKIENMLLKKRHDLIQSGTPRTAIKIKNLRLYIDNKLVDTSS